MRAPYRHSRWAGAIVYLISLLGTLLLAKERARHSAVLLVIAVAVMAVLLWRQQQWIPAFSAADVPSPTADVKCRRFLYLFGLLIALTFALAADLRYGAAPNETFGLAGILWLAGIGLMILAAFLGSSLAARPLGTLRSAHWPNWEIVLVIGLFCLALLSRVWNLANFPENIYPDEIMTGTVATQSYIRPTGPPPSL